MRVDLDLGQALIIGQGGRSNAKNCVWTSLFDTIYLTLRSRSKVWVKIRGQLTRGNVWCVEVDIRGSAC